ncbi:MAG TPA: transglutaminase-like domain-containing protein [Methylomirabilota bacterium]|nr:transglutaminase-like domain-containing protein [Methylomirabilota bacterium]
MTGDERRYYATQSRVSDPGDRARLLDALPAEPGRLVAAVSALVLHPLFVGPLGITLPGDSADDVESRTVPRILDRILARDPAPLDEPRPPARRFIGICRDYALLACAALRHHRVPARVRVGFANYFTPGYLEDHWVCEYAAGDRWRLLDPELADGVRTHFGIAFDPADVPRDAFLVAGEAWRRARAGAVDPQTCGVPRIGVVGAGFIAASVARDLAALNKREMLAWDVWGLPLALRPGVPVPEATARRLDAVAALTAGPELDWPAVRDAHDRDDGFRVPAVVTSFTARGPTQVAVDVEPPPAPATP